MTVFTYDRSEYPSVFNEAVDVVDNLLLSDDNIVKICRPIASEYNRKKGTKKFTNSELVASVRATLSKGITVVKGAAEKTVMQMSVHEKYLAMPESASDIERLRCKLLLISKVLHEIFHALTNTFWALCGYPPELNEDGTIATVQSTPPQLGRVYGTGNRVIGDNGYAFEEEHFRGRLMDSPTTGFSSQLLILIPELVLNKSKVYIVPDARALEVLHTLQSGILKENFDLSLYYANYEQFKKPRKATASSSGKSGSFRRGRRAAPCGATE